MTGDLPTGDLPMGDLPTGDLPTGDLPTGDLPTGDLPTTACSAADQLAFLRIQALWSVSTRMLLPTTSPALTLN